MQLQVVVELVRKWAPLVVALAVLGAAIGFGVSKTMTREYQATGEVLVSAGLRLNVSGASTNVSASTGEATTTVANLLMSADLLQSVIDSNHLGYAEASLASRVKANQVTNSQLVAVTATDSSAERAALIANAIMSRFVAQVRQQNVERINQASDALYSQIALMQVQLDQDERQLAGAGGTAEAAGLMQRINSEALQLSQMTLNYDNFRATQQQDVDTVSVASKAATPTAAASPRTTLNSAVGGVVGLFVGIGIATAVEYMRQRIRTAESVRRELGVRCIGVVPHSGSGAPDVRVTAEDQGSDAAEAYRRIRATVLSAGADLKSVVMTSACSGGGTTRTAVNLAVTLAGAGRRVVLVDANLRRPTLHRVFASTLAGGVSETINGTEPIATSAASHIRTTQYENLSLLTGGKIPPSPADLLSSTRVGALIRSLEATFDVVVVDTSSIDSASDALSIAAVASASILVVGAGVTNASRVVAALEALDGVGSKVLGVVLNGAPVLRVWRRLSGKGEAVFETGEEPGLGHRSPTTAAD